MRFYKSFFFIGSAFSFCLAFFMGYYKSIVKEKTYAGIQMIQAKWNLFSTDISQVPVLAISIPEESYAKLSLARNIALQKGFLLKEGEEFVSAEIHYNNQYIPVKLRLKGDYPDHFDTDKWSFRIKSEIPIWGMKKFSIQHPKTRRFISEWFFYQALKHEGLIALNYFFIKVIINGEDKGVFALEEFFDDALLIRNHCEPTPITKFNDNISWIEMSQYIDSGIVKSSMWQNVYYMCLEHESVDAFNLDRVLKDSLSRRQFNYAKDLLYGFMDSVLPASKVFDLDQYPKYMALCEALGAEHSLFWHNLRFYFNPQTKRLEPIGYDANIVMHTEKEMERHFVSAMHTDTYIRLLLNDSVFARHYLYWLNYYTQPLFLSNLEKEFSDKLQNNLDLLHTEWPDITLPYDIWNHNRKLIQSSFSSSTAIAVHLKDTLNNEIHLKVNNEAGLPVEIIELCLNDSISILPSSKLILLRFPQYSHIRFPFHHQLKQDSKLVIKYHVLGLDEIQTQKVILKNQLNR